MIYQADNKTASTGRGRDPVRRRAESSVKRRELLHDEVRVARVDQFFFAIRQAVRRRTNFFSCDYSWRNFLVHDV